MKRTLLIMLSITIASTSSFAQVSNEEIAAAKAATQKEVDEAVVARTAQVDALLTEIQSLKVRIFQVEKESLFAMKVGFIGITISGVLAATLLSPRIGQYVDVAAMGGQQTVIGRLVLTSLIGAGSFYRVTLNEKQLSVLKAKLTETEAKLRVIRAALN